MRAELLLAPGIRDDHRGSAGFASTSPLAAAADRELGESQTGNRDADAVERVELREAALEERMTKVEKVLGRVVEEAEFLGALRSPETGD